MCGRFLWNLFLKRNTCWTKLQTGEKYSFLEEAITIKILDSIGNFFIEISNTYTNDVLLNKNKIYEVSQGKSGDQLTIDGNNYVILRNEHAFLADYKGNGQIKKTLHPGILGGSHIFLNARMSGWADFLDH